MGIVFVKISFHFENILGTKINKRRIDLRFNRSSSKRTKSRYSKKNSKKAKTKNKKVVRIEKR